MTPHERAHRILAASDGACRRSALTSAGLSRAWVRQAIADGRLHEVWPGVVALEASPEMRLLGAVRYAGTGAQLSHVTAATLLGLGDWSRRHPDVHVRTPPGSHRRSAPGLVLHQGPTTDRWWRGPLPITPAVQTLVDCAVVLDVPDLRAAATSAVRQGLATVAGLQAATVPRRESRTWRRLVEEIEAGAWSGPEAGYWRLLKDARLPLPELNARVETAGGTRYVDALWRELRFGAEIDGRSFHAQEAAFESDRYRQNSLIVKGLVLLRFPAADIDRRPEEVLRVTAEALYARAEELGHQWTASDRPFCLSIERLRRSP